MKKLYFALVALLLLPGYTIRAQDLDSIINQYGFEIFQLVRNLQEIDFGEDFLTQVNEYENYLEFDPVVGRISKISNSYNIEIDPNIISGSEKIAYWKVRVRCEDGLGANYNFMSICNSTFSTESFSESLLFTLINNVENSKSANIKLRAFDSNDFWIKSEDINVTIPANK